MKNRKELISIVIPIYNSELFLKECILSVVNQTYENLEIVLVDDGSTDNSLEICKELAKKYKNIVVIHKENGGVVSARNAGLENCTGDYIAFIDSDDYMDNTMIENLYKAIIEEQCDVSVENVNINPKILDDKKIFYEEEILEELFLERNFWGVLHGKLVSREIIGKVRFNPEMNISEDLEFLFNTLQNAKKVVVIPQKEYKYSIRQESLSHKEFCYEIWESEIQFIEELIKRYENNQKMKYALINRLLRVLSNNILEFKMSKADYRKLKKILFKYKKSLMSSSMTTKKEKIKLFVVCYCRPMKIIFKMKKSFKKVGCDEK